MERIPVKEIFEGLCEGLGLLVIILTICFFVFGGEFSIKINFHSVVNLWNTIFKK
jgi:hypothetical protein